MNQNSRFTNLAAKSFSNSLNVWKSDTARRGRRVLRFGFGCDFVAAGAVPCPFGITADRQSTLDVIKFLVERTVGGGDGACAMF